MKTKWMALGAVMTCGPIAAADEGPAMPELPQATEQHEWLHKFVGEWNVRSEIHMAPGEEPVVATGTETARMLGDFWVVAEGQGEISSADLKSKWILSFGYEPEEGRYVGRWIDSMTPASWDYTGNVSEDGKVMTLSTRGFCPMEGEVCEFRSTVEFKSDDVRVITDEKKTDEGWETAVVSTYTRKEGTP